MQVEKESTNRSVDAKLNKAPGKHKMYGDIDFEHPELDIDPDTVFQKYELNDPAKITVIRQIDRIGYLSPYMSINPSRYIDAVEHLWMVLKPFSDLKFDNAIKEANKKMYESTQGKKINLIHSQKIFAMKKFDICMRLIKRKNLMGRPVI